MATYLDTLATAAVAIAACIVVLDGLMRILEQFGRHTSKRVSAGVVLVTAGAAFWFTSPIFCGALLIIGRALQILGGMRRGTCV
jgi:hypothetical protein